MTRDGILFYGGIVLIAIGLLVWLIRPNGSNGKTKITFPGGGVEIDVPALAVMLLGAVIVSQSRDHYVPPESPIRPEPPIRKVACYGEHRSSCAGAHDLYYDCGPYLRHHPENELGQIVCHGPAKSMSQISLKDGDRCGYSLYEVICPVK